MKSVKPLFFLLSIALLFTACPNPSGGPEKPAEPEKALFIAAGETHSLVVFGNKKLKVSGSNEVGQLGLGYSLIFNNFLQITERPWKTNSIKSIAAGGFHSLVLTEDNKLYVCGENDRGELGLGHTTNQKNFTEVNTLPADISIKSIAAGLSHSLVLTGDNKLYACGSNGYGQLGLGNTGIQPSFTLVDTLPADISIKSIAAGQYHSLVLTEDNKLYASGNNEQGQLGLGHTTYQPSFTLVNTLPAGISIKSIAAGYCQSLVLTEDNKLYGCGSNSSGQLGLGDTADQNSFTLVNTLPADISIKSIAAGHHHSLVLTENGTLYACGYNSYGQLGLENTTYQPSFTLVDTLPADISIKSIAAGYEHSLVLTEDNKLYGCGRNSSGQLGLGDIANQPSFTLVNTLPADISIKSIAAGHHHNLVLTEDNKLYASGYNGQGQLGLGDIVDRNSFTLVGTLPADISIKSIAAGYGHSLVLTEDNKLYGCGRNNYGQLGLGNTTKQTTFTLVDTLPADISIKSIAAGYYHSLVLTEDNKLYASGYNNAGQLGLGNTTNLPSFTLVNIY